MGLRFKSKAGKMMMPAMSRTTARKAAEGTAKKAPKKAAKK